jgi:hypothetical protein
MMTGAEVHAQIDALMENQEGDGFVGYSEEHMWTHKSGLTRLPYFDDLLMPHYIDVMHTALWGTIMETEKSKDNPKARVDLAELCDKPHQEMRAPRGGKTWKRPKTYFILTPRQRRELLQWI